MRKLFALMLAGSMLASCSVTSSLKTSQRKMNRQAEANANSAKVVNKPILADLEVDMKRATTTYKTTNKDIGGTMFINTGGSSSKKGNILATASEGMKNEAKSRAQFQFMAEHKCDYLVDPIYKIETESTSEANIVNITVEVSAYPANYKKFTQPDSLPKSVFQADQVDGREIALSTYSSSFDKTEKKKSSGLIFGVGLSKLATVDGEKTEDGKSSIGAFGGYYLSLPLSSKLSFRTEYLLSYKTARFETETSVGFGTLTQKLDYSNISFQLPFMLQISPANSFSIYVGPALNYIAAWNYKYESTIAYTGGGSDTETDNGDYSELYDFNPLQGSLVLGFNYQTKGKVGLGIRHDSGLGADNWNMTSLNLSIKLK